jgi:hypothetical protein
MKYRLRSLMKFSIRDLMWITAVVALLLVWWTERLRLQRENWRLIRENRNLEIQVSDEQNAHKAASAQRQGYQELHSEAVGETKRLKHIIDEMEMMKRNTALPTSQAPAPIPPNFQSGPDNYP